MTNRFKRFYAKLKGEIKKEMEDNFNDCHRKLTCIMLNHHREGLRRPEHEIELLFNILRDVSTVSELVNDVNKEAKRS